MTSSRPPGIVFPCPSRDSSSPDVLLPELRPEVLHAPPADEPFRQVDITPPWVNAQRIVLIATVGLPPPPEAQRVEEALASACTSCGQRCPETDSRFHQVMRYLLRLSLRRKSRHRMFCSASSSQRCLLLRNQDYSPFTTAPLQSEPSE